MEKLRTIEYELGMVRWAYGMGVLKEYIQVQGDKYVSHGRIIRGEWIH